MPDPTQNQEEWPPESFNRYAESAAKMGDSAEQVRMILMGTEGWSMADVEGQMLQLLWYWQGDFCQWDPDEHRYKKVSEEFIKGILWSWEANFRTFQKKPSYRVPDMCRGLKSVCQLGDMRVPGWTYGEPFDGADHTLLLRTGQLDLRDMSLAPPDPQLFNFNVLPVEYNAEAPTPQRWMRFLNELWPLDVKGNEQNHRLLQEWFGYCLLRLTRYQKILLMVGPKRAGKGTANRVLQAMLGEDENVCYPLLSDLSDKFSLEVMLGKQLAIFQDARMGARGQSRIVETLLSLSGDDDLSIQRKHQTRATLHRDNLRMVIVTNEIPHLHDPILPSRFLILEFVRSLYGNEDARLTDTLLGELSAIFAWSIEGLTRLLKRGQFVQPETGEATREELMLLGGGPVPRFVEACCDVGPHLYHRTEEVYRAFLAYCDANGLDAANVRLFGRQLKAAVLGLARTKRFWNPPATGPAPSKKSCYTKIRLKAGTPLAPGADTS